MAKAGSRQEEMADIVDLKQIPAFGGTTSGVSPPQLIYNVKLVRAS